MLEGLFKEGLCGWCGTEIVGEAVAPYGRGPLTAGGGDKAEVELMPGFKCAFCSEGCAWSFGVELDKRYLRGRELRRHLEVEHGLVCGPAPHPQSADCRKYFETEARVLEDWELKARLAQRFGGRVV